MHFSIFLLTFSIFMGSGLVDGKPPARMEDLSKRQSDAANGCVNTCGPFLRDAQSCISPSCLCTATNQNNLQLCLNCLGSIPDSSLSDSVGQGAQAFNQACAGTATVTAAGTSSSGGSQSGGGGLGGSFSDSTGNGGGFGGGNTAGGGLSGFSTAGGAGAFPTGSAGGGLTGGGNTTGNATNGGGLGSTTNQGSNGGSNSNTPPVNGDPFTAGKAGGESSTMKKSSLGVLAAVSLFLPLFF